MCIALLTTAHPSYSLIVLSNRDEYLSRPTAVAQWWSPSHSAPPSTTEPLQILGGRDLLRPEQGTWLGLSRGGRLAVLTNYREDVLPGQSEAPIAPISRGAIVRSFLEAEGKGTEEWVKELIYGVDGEAGAGAGGLGGKNLEGVGGFSCVCGVVGKPDDIERGRLAVVGNRMAKTTANGGDLEIPWICGDAKMTVGLSNAAFGDRDWKKVTDGEDLLDGAIKESVKRQESEDEFLGRCFNLLSTDTLPALPQSNAEGGEVGMESYLNLLRNTILVPPIGKKEVLTSTTTQADEVATAAADREEVVGPATQHKSQITPSISSAQLGMSGMYGTQKQTVILVGHTGQVRFIERTLYDNDSNPVPTGKGDVDVRFQIEG